jgi:DNA-binding SARP family transcriptional activator
MVLRIRLLGSLEAEADGVPVTLPPGGRVRGLLAWLALHPGPHPRARLAGWLWPDVPEASARASLRSAVWALRQALGPGCSGCLVANRQSVGLSPDRVSVDVIDFGRLAAAGRLTEAAGLCRGELLYELDHDWVGEARDAHTRALARVFAGLAREAAAAGCTGDAAEWARRRAALEPLDEEAGRDLVRRLAEAGDVAGALCAYRSLSRRLRRELGIGPSRDTRRLAGQVRANRTPPPPGDRTPPPPGHRTPPPPGHRTVPAPPAPLA